MIKSTSEKALWVNLEPEIYGTFSEIGAGQDVANNFFKAGAASGTIAKTLSAYDMSISNSHYGQTKRFVSKERLQDMLQIEYDLLLNQLSEMAQDKKFFVFSSTVETLNFHKTNQGQGWIGVKYQPAPEKASEELIIHVLLHGEDAFEQQELLGTLGVNLLYEIFQPHESLESLMKKLLENIKPGKLEINTLITKGERFQDEHPRLTALKLVKHGLTKMAMFSPQNEVLQPLNSLYKKNVLMLRGRFNPPTLVHEDMFKTAEQYRNISSGDNYEKSLLVAELTMTNLNAEDENIDLDDYLRRTELLTVMGYNIMITNFSFHHDLTDYMEAFVNLKSLNLIVGTTNLEQICNRRASDSRNTLSVFSSLCNAKNKLLIYPRKDQVSGEAGCLDKLSVSEFDHLIIAALVRDKKIVQLRNANTEHLDIYSDNVLKLIRSNSEEWKDQVPEKLVRAVLAYSKNANAGNSMQCQTF